MNKTNCYNNQNGSFRLNYRNAMSWSFGSPHLQLNGPSLSSLLAALASSPNTQGDRSLALSCKNCKEWGDRQPREEKNRKKRLSEKNHTSKSITIHLSKFCLFSSFLPSSLPSSFTEQLLLSEIVREGTAAHIFTVQSILVGRAPRRQTVSESELDNL